MEISEAERIRRCSHLEAFLGGWVLGFARPSLPPSSPSLNQRWRLNERSRAWEKVRILAHSLYPIAFHYECLSVLKAKGKSSSFHHVFSLCRFQLFLYLESFQFCLFKCDLKLIHIPINFLKNSKGLVSFHASTLLIRPDLQGPWCFEPHSSLICFSRVVSLKMLLSYQADRYKYGVTMI